jgi:hypothetical protein
MMKNEGANKTCFYLFNYWRLAGTTMEKTAPPFSLLSLRVALLQAAPH